MNTVHTSSNTLTNGIRVEVFPSHIPEDDSPQDGRYYFSYRIKITNEGSEWAKLLARKWIIIDSEGKTEEIEGPGVVGYTPELKPSESFTYTSFCPLDTQWGTMEGWYYFKRQDGEEFDVRIDRFYLVEPSLTDEDMEEKKS
jgi:ApaG protein